MASLIFFIALLPFTWFVNGGLTGCERCSYYELGVHTSDLIALDAKANTGNTAYPVCLWIGFIIQLDMLFCQGLVM